MERTNIGTVIPLDANWSDLGGWNSIWEANKKDKNGNFKWESHTKRFKNC